MEANFQLVVENLRLEKLRFCPLEPNYSSIENYRDRKLVEFVKFSI